MNSSGYASSWLADQDLATLNARIHDGVPAESLMDRGRGYRDWVFDMFPDARPQPGDHVLELGSGVGWIMEAVLERFEIREIVGLDISPNMVKRARERFKHPKAGFVLYDGLRMPFGDGRFEVAYSVATMQHIEKHVAFVLFEEINRVMAPGGHAVVHLLGVEHIPESVTSYDEECWNHIRGAETFWCHYYSFDELFVLFSRVIGVSDLDIVYHEPSKSFFVHFGKGGSAPYLRGDLPRLTYTERLAAARSPEEVGEPRPQSQDGRAISDTTEAHGSSKGGPLRAEANRVLGRVRRALRDLS